MQYRHISLAAGAALSIGLAACDRSPTDNDTPPAVPERVELSIFTDPSQALETCGEIRVTATAARARKPVRGIVVNFVPVAGSVFAAAVATNNNGEATTYWNLGSIFQPNTRLIARAVDEDGNRVLDDTLEVSKRQKPTLFAERGILLSSDLGAEYRWMLVGRVRLLDGCGDPIPNAVVTSVYSGPIPSIDPAAITFPTLGFDFPDAERWGEAVVGYRFSNDTPVPPTGYRITWHSVEVPSVTVTQYW